MPQDLLVLQTHSAGWPRSMCPTFASRASQVWPRTPPPAGPFQIETLDMLTAGMTCRKHFPAESKQFASHITVLLISTDVSLLSFLSTEMAVHICCLTLSFLVPFLATAMIFRPSLNRGTSTESKRGIVEFRTKVAHPST